MKYIKGKFITTAELAKRWGVSQGTLRNKRTAHTGPPYEKLGTHVFYDIDKLIKWEATHRRDVVNES